MKRLVLLVLFVVSVPLAWSQGFQVTGKIVQKKNSRPIAGVHVRVTNQRDTTDRVIVETDTIGLFLVGPLRGKSYRLETTYLGYAKQTLTVENRNALVDLGTIALADSTIPLKEYVVEGRIPPSVQKGDTTEYTAQAFKVNKDASAEDLVGKMPGVTVQNGTVTAQGENIQQVLVDGRPFFGADPTLSLRTLPAEVIDKVQVFDKLSDQAQLTGYDDGQSIKTMNIVTRADRRRGDFGRLNGGYGTDDRYMASGAVNFFQGDQRISIIGLSNNVNQQNFSTQDLLGVMGGGNQRGGMGGGGGSGRRSGFGGGGRGGGGGGGFQGGASSNFLVGQQAGISTTNSVGINYADSLGSSVYMNGSYFFNLAHNENPERLTREYLLSADSSSFYGENDATDRRNYNHRVNLRVEYSPDSSNAFILTPQVYVQNNHTSSSVFDTSTTAAAEVLSESQNTNLTSTDGYTTSSHVTYRHRFPTLGRTLSLDVGLSGNRKTASNSLSSFDAYFNSQNALYDTIDQRSGVTSNGYTLSTSVVYTEPISSSSLLQVNYAPTYTKNVSDNRTFNFDDGTGDFTTLNSALSNSFENYYVTNAAGLGYRFHATGVNVSAGVSYQISRLRNNQTFPSFFTIGRSFFSLLPNLMMNYEFSNRRSLRVFYRTSTNAPSVSQLQNIVDNTNPLLLSTGNPDLKQSFSHTLLARLGLSNPENAQSVMAFVYVSFTHDNIANATITARRDTTVRGGLLLYQGTQLTYPVNLNGFWNVRTLLTYGLPFDFVHSNLNLNMGFNYTRTPGLLNDLLTVSNVYAASPGFVLGSSISEDIDFTVSYTANFNIAHSAVQSASDNNYFNHTAGLRLNWIFWEGFVFKSDVSNTLYHGLSGGLDQDYVLWNLSLGKKILPDQRGEINFTIYDVLNQNRSISRTVTDTYIEDATTRVLQRYVMLTFTYNLRQFSGEQQRPEFPRERPFGRPPDRDRRDED